MERGLISWRTKELTFGVICPWMWIGSSKRRIPEESFPEKAILKLEDWICKFTGPELLAIFAVAVTWSVGPKRALKGCLEKPKDRAIQSQVEVGNCLTLQSR